MGYKAGVVGAAGFAGIEVVRIILSHPDFELAFATSDANAGVAVAELYPDLLGKCSLPFQSNTDVSFQDVDVVFLAVPHTASLTLTPKILEAGTSVIDLSADYRLKDADIYESWYDCEHTSSELLEHAAFGLPEIKGEEIEEAASAHAKGDAVLVACAGCYPTATSLAAAPTIEAGLMKPDSIVVADAISGVTGAGKKATERTHFCNANENVEAYGVTTHRHTPEIEQILGIEGQLIFTPHLAPLNRGLLSTVNIPIDEEQALTDDMDTTEDFLNLYREYYEDSPFVEVLPEGTLPKTSSVVSTNKAHVGVVYEPDLHMLIGICAIDNLVKGAAGQAVQCANIVFGLPETSGLE